MARLNEVLTTAATATTETIEGVKRRLLRQNRDLAKTNSVYAVRIRFLEAENTRLTTELLDKQEEILRLQNQLESLNEDPATIRQEVELKLHEILDTLMRLPSSDLPEAKRRRKSPRKEPLRRPERHSSVDDEYAESRLPAIVEDKQWPRLSLSAPSSAELDDAQIMDSPDLASPPVARFNLEEAKCAETEMSVASPDEEEVPHNLNENIETRRRRKDSIKRIMVFSETQSSQEEEIAAQDESKTRKRKQIDQADDDDEEEVQDSSFTFSLKSSIKSEPVVPERKALSSKPINTDPMVSPKKPRLKLGLEKPTEKSVKRSTPTLSSKEAARQRIKERRQQKESRISPVDDMTPVAIPPKTPAALEDLFSPTSATLFSEPHTGSFTPPPNTEASGRVSRRARSAVNYAEPSLNSKMRRPTKDLVDAVGKDGKPLTIGTLVKQIEKPTSQWKPAYSASMTDTTSRAEPASPLKDKLSAAPVIETSTETVEVKAAPLAKARRRSQAVKDEQKVEDIRKAEMAIFDFTDSSPSESTQTKDANKSSGSRRHSMLGNHNQKEKAEVKSRTSSSTATSKMITSRRRSMMI